MDYEKKCLNFLLRKMILIILYPDLPVGEREDDPDREIPCEEL
jgi:hypothetical protein